MIKGERLRKLRCDKSMTQKEVAAIMGLDKSTICAYEINQRRPNYETLFKYSELFGASIEYLFGIDKMAVKEDGEPFNIALTNEEVQFLKLLRKEKMIYDILLEDPKRGVEIIKRKVG